MIYGTVTFFECIQWISAERGRGDRTSNRSSVEGHIYRRSSFSKIAFVSILEGRETWSMSAPPTPSCSYMKQYTISIATSPPPLCLASLCLNRDVWAQTIAGILNRRFGWGRNALWSTPLIQSPFPAFYPLSFGGREKEKCFFLYLFHSSFPDSTSKNGIHEISWWQIPKLFQLFLDTFLIHIRHLPQCGLTSALLSKFIRAVKRVRKANQYTLVKWNWHSWYNHFSRDNLLINISFRNMILSLMTLFISEKWRYDHCWSLIECVWVR